MDRDAIINMVAEMVPAGFTVDLKHPDVVVVVQVVGRLTGVSVVQKWEELCKYNIRVIQQAFTAGEDGESKQE